MDPSIIVAALAVVQVLWQAYTKYKSEKNKIQADSQSSLAGVVDKRIQLILDSNAAELERLKAVDQELRDVLAFLRANSIRWPITNQQEEAAHEIESTGGETR